MLGSCCRVPRVRCATLGFDVKRRWRFLLGFGFWVLGFGFWVLGFGFWVLGFGFWVLGFGFWVLGFGNAFALRLLNRNAVLVQSPGSRSAPWVRIADFETQGSRPVSFLIPQAYDRRDSLTDFGQNQYCLSIAKGSWQAVS